MIRKIAAVIGPGFIIAAVVLGPGSMTVATKVGSLFGYGMLWWLWLLWAFMCAYTAMSAQIGLMDPRSLMTIVADRFGRAVSVILGLAVFFICCSFQTGDVIGVSAALSTIFHVPEIVFKLLFPAVCIWLYYHSGNTYKIIERLMLLMIVMMVVAFFANLFQAKPDLGQMARGLVPRLPEAGQMGLIGAMAGTNFVVAAAFYQSYLIKEKGWTPAQAPRMLVDTLAGITVLFVLVGVIQVTSAAVLAPRGINVTSVSDMALQLEPLLGRFAKFMFCMGLFAASFSSLMVNALTGGTLLADGLGKDYRMTGPYVKHFATAIMLFGLVISITLGGKPVPSIIFLQKFTLLTVPLLGAALIWAFFSAGRVKGPKRIFIGVLAAAGFLLLLYLFGDLVKSFFCR